MLTKPAPQGLLLRALMIILSNIVAFSFHAGDDVPGRGHDGERTYHRTLNGEKETGKEPSGKRHWKVMMCTLQVSTLSKFSEIIEMTMFLLSEVHVTFVMPKMTCKMDSMLLTNANTQGLLSSA
eukprot:1156533-Pelagomonas_calceolata.AAC.2